MLNYPQQNWMYVMKIKLMAVAVITCFLFLLGRGALITFSGGHLTQSAHQTGSQVLLLLKISNIEGERGQFGLNIMLLIMVTGYLVFVLLVRPFMGSILPNSHTKLVHESC